MLPLINISKIYAEKQTTKEKPWLQQHKKYAVKKKTFNEFFCQCWILFLLLPLEDFMTDL